MLETVSTSTIVHQHILKNAEQVKKDGYYKMGGRMLTGKIVWIIMSLGLNNSFPKTAIMRRYKLSEVWVNYLQGGGHPKWYRVPDAYGRDELLKQQARDAIQK